LLQQRHKEKRRLNFCYFPQSGLDLLKERV